MKIRVPVAALGPSFALAAALAVFAHDEARAADRSDTHQSALIWSAQPTTPVDTQELTFKSGEATLSGALYAPKVEGRIPAVIVFHSASAPTRDNPLYRHLVEMLPPLKIAVFVFDRRGSGKSGGKLEDSDYAMLADDGIAAQRMLGQDRRIDARRIGFWGLSQGGWLSLLAASRSPQAAFAISASAPMTTPDDHAMATSVSAVDQIDPVISAKEAPQATQYFALLGAWLARHGIASIP